MSGLAAYRETQAASDEWLIGYVPLVRRIAYHLMSRLPSSVQVDDLIQAGMIGLLEASRNYDPSQGASFETYAGIRIRGSMLDEIRKGDWAPRSLHRKVREVSGAIREIEREAGRDARDTEVAERLGLTMEEYLQILRDAAGHRILSLEDVSMGEDPPAGLAEQGTGPLESLETQRFKDALASTISELPERERLVMALYYDEELNLREIGALLGVSEARACQIHGQALVRVKARMIAWRGEPDGAPDAAE